MKWNGQIREGLKYMGNNTFTGGLGHAAIFELIRNGDPNVKLRWATVLKRLSDLQGTRAFQY
jgi:hypothetical protein